MMCRSPSLSEMKTEIHNRQRGTSYTMIGPSLGTYSPPMTRTSVKKESTARPEMKRIKRCKACVSEEVIQELYTTKSTLNAEALRLQYFKRQDQGSQLKLF